jgi:hypothetical protein
MHDWAKEEYPTNGKHDEDEYEVVDYTPKDIKASSIINVDTSDVVWKFSDFRGNKEQFNRKLGVETGYKGGEPYLRKYPYPHRDKFRLLPKSFNLSINAGFTTDHLLGANIFPSGCSQKLVIVEGEEDWVSAYQILNEGGTFNNPVVSLPSATPSGKLWSNYFDYLDGFDNLLLSVDPDDAGNRVAEKIFDLFPKKVYKMQHGGLKDANEILQAGRGKSYKSSWFTLSRFSPAGFTSTADEWEEAVRSENPYEAIPSFCTGLNKVTRGWVKGGITIIKAPPGAGKTSIFRKAQHDLVIKQSCKVAVLHMEEMKSTTGRGLASYELGNNVTTKIDAQENGFTEDQVVEALRKVVDGGRFVSFEVNPQNAIESTLEQCTKAIDVYEVDFVFLDHFQRLAYLAGTDGATASLTELGVKLAELSKRKNVGIIGISHVNADGHTKYAKAIEEEAIILISLERDKTSEDNDIRNTTYLSVEKNRPFSLTGPAGMLYYDTQTTLVDEKIAHQPETPNRKGLDF